MQWTKENHENFVKKINNLTIEEKKLFLENSERIIEIAKKEKKKKSFLQKSKNEKKK